MSCFATPSGNSSDESSERLFKGSPIHTCLEQGVRPEKMCFTAFFEYAVSIKFHELSQRRRSTIQLLTKICLKSRFFLNHEMPLKMQQLTGHVGKGKKETRKLAEEAAKPRGEGPIFHNAKKSDDGKVSDVGVDGGLELSSGRLVIVQITLEQALAKKENLITFGLRVGPTQTSNEGIDDEFAKGKLFQGDYPEWPGLSGLLIIGPLTEVKADEARRWRARGVLIYRFSFAEYMRYMNSSVGGNGRQKNGESQRKRPKLVQRGVPPHQHEHDTVVPFPTEKDFEIYRTRLKPLHVRKTLWTEQEKMCDIVVKWIGNAIILQSPTGTGKAVVAGHIMEDLVWMSKFASIQCSRSERIVPGSDKNHHCCPKEVYKPAADDLVIFFLSPRLNLLKQFNAMLIDFGLLQRMFGPDYAEFYEPVDSKHQSHRIDIVLVERLYMRGVRIFGLTHLKANVVREFQKKYPGIASVIYDECHLTLMDNWPLDAWKMQRREENNRFTWEKKTIEKQNKEGKLTYEEHSETMTEKQQEHRAIVARIDAERDNKRCPPGPDGHFVSDAARAVVEAGQHPRTIGVFLSATPTKVHEEVGAKLVYWCSDDRAIREGRMADYVFQCMSLVDVAEADHGEEAAARWRSNTKEKMSTAKIKENHMTNQMIWSAMQLIDGLQVNGGHFPYVPCGGRVDNIYFMKEKIEEAFEMRVVHEGFEDVELNFYLIHTDEMKDGKKKRLKTHEEAMEDLERFKAARPFVVRDEKRIPQWHVVMDCGMIATGTDVPKIDSVLLCALPLDFKDENGLIAVIQAIGRALRVHHSKRLAHIYIPRSATDVVVHKIQDYQYRYDKRVDPVYEEDDDMDEDEVDDEANVGCHFTVRTIAKRSHTDTEQEKRWLLDREYTLKLRQKYDRKNYKVERMQRRMDEQKKLVALKSKAVIQGYKKQIRELNLMFSHKSFEGFRRVPCMVLQRYMCFPRVPAFEPGNIKYMNKVQVPQCLRSWLRKRGLRNSHKNRLKYFAAPKSREIRVRQGQGNGSCRLCMEHAQEDNEGTVAARNVKARKERERLDGVIWDSDSCEDSESESECEEGEEGEQCSECEEDEESEEDEQWSEDEEDEQWSEDEEGEEGEESEEGEEGEEGEESEEDE